MAEPLYSFQFQTRQYYDGNTGNNTAKGSTLTFEDLDSTLLFLSSSINNGGTSFVGLTTSSVNLNTIYFSKSDGTTFSITVDTGSGQTYTAGNGLNLINNEFSSKILTVNGASPINGNVTTTLTSVLTGPSASGVNNLIASSSGNNTGSLTNGIVWIVSGDSSTPSPNGLAYIFVSQSVDAGGYGKWYPLDTLNQTQADIRYVKLVSSTTQTLTSSLLISGSTTFSGSLFLSGASDLAGATNNVLVLGIDGKIYKTGSYGTGGGGPGTPGGANTTIQFNDAGAFSGSGNFTFNKTTNVVNLIGTGSITGSMIISRSVEGTPLTIIGTGSSPILNVVGSTGNLLQTYDQTSGSIFTVGDSPSGLPIVRVTSNRETFIGSSNAPGLYNSFITSSVNTGVYTVYQLPTSSYSALWIDYAINSGSNFVAGTYNSMWSASLVRENDITGSNLGNTATIGFSTTITSGNANVEVRVNTTNGWTIKGIIRAV